MKIIYPAKMKVSIWVGTFEDEAAFDQAVERVAGALKLPADITRICEVAFERQPVPIADLIAGFSGWQTFASAAKDAALAKCITSASAALVCYFVQCMDVPDQFGPLTFLGSFEGNDRTEQ